jgi:hypothetical protein
MQGGIAATATATSVDSIAKNAERVVMTETIAGEIGTAAAAIATSVAMGTATAAIGTANAAGTGIAMGTVDAIFIATGIATTSARAAAASPMTMAIASAAIGKPSK